MWKFTESMLCALFLSSLAVSCMAADHGRERGEHQRARIQPWHGDIHRFHEHDMARWRSGHWFHGRHAGQSGWWWIVGPTWYFYPARVYPYPDPFLPPIVTPSPAAPATAPGYWYYCPNPPGYYPYVARCNQAWQRVPATPP